MQELVPWTLVSSKKPAIPRAVLKEDAAAVRRNDLLDTGVYVCSPTVLVHFSDNYDYKVRVWQSCRNNDGCANYV